MIEIIALIAVLIISLLLVIKSADIFVDNLVEIGLALGISEIILGVTASAVGTSLPEFGSAMIAILTGNPEMGISVAIGASIWNIAGILGISTIVTGLIVAKKDDIKRDGVMALLTALVLTIFMFLFGELTFTLGIILTIMYLAYFWILIRAQKKDRAVNGISVPQEHKKPITKKKIFYVIIGLAGLAVGCRIIVYSTVELAEILNIPAALAGILLAFGTTAPEFFTVLTSARKGLSRLAVGTVLGSNIFNILIGLGIPALFITIPVESITRNLDGPALVLISILLLLLLKKDMKLTRISGIILLASYIVYIGVRIVYMG
ncbi:MAG: calcium/sodium antiporter [Methanobacteriaceae archaeon]|nr:calcium/sodium antiporter [Methanobacteriaceae archaeon]